tara:strand:- start:328 stop:561 length:234 start_codon:yes stop_codon:yes gene_type:complete
MAKVSVKFGLNIPIDLGNRFDRFTPEISINDIDTDSDYPVEHQIVDALSALEQVWTRVSDEITSLTTKELEREVTLP